jgi:hypothetical protein
MPEKQPDESQSPVPELVKKAETSSVESGLAKLVGEKGRTDIGGVLETPVDAKARELSPDQQTELLLALKARFASQPEHYKRLDVNFTQLKEAIESNPDAWSIYQMEITGGEPDIMADDYDSFLFWDFSKESPKGRRNCVYDKDAEMIVKQRGEECNGNAIDMANEFGADMTPVSVYRMAQRSGKFDLETKTIAHTPAETRKSGESGQMVVVTRDVSGVREFLYPASYCNDRMAPRFLKRLYKKGYGPRRSE